ncbi:MAG: hypothetical protein GXX94_08835 [Chloroflexi bacterium]|nr:hypothetical protein [Chloroflexota bacterium]
MGPFVVHWLDGEEASAGAPDGDRRSTAAGRVIYQLERGLTSRRLLAGLGAILLLLVLLVGLYPDTRQTATDRATGLLPGLGYLWDGMSPLIAWMLRAVLVALAGTLSVRLMASFSWGLDLLTRGGEPLSLVSAALGDASAVWRRAGCSLGAPTALTGDCSLRRQAVFAPAPLRRLYAAARPAGMLIAVLGLLTVLLRGYSVSSQVLMAGEALSLSDRLNRAVQLQAITVEDAGARSSVQAKVIWTRASGDQAELPALSTHWRFHDGYWVRVARAVPAVRLWAESPSGAPLALVPVTGDRQAVSTYRGALGPGEEAVLTVPEAGIVLRLMRVPGQGARDRLIVEALDGGLGTVVDRVEAGQAGTMDLDGAAILVAAEHGGVLSFWRLPGMVLVPLGLALSLAGVVLSRRYPPECAWIGIAPAGTPGRWQVMLAASPSRLAEDLVRRLESG